MPEKPAPSPANQQPTNDPVFTKTHYDFLLGPLLFALLSAITLAVYWPGLDGPFLLDDRASIQNIDIQELNIAELTRVILSNGSGQTGRPVSVLSLVLTQQTSGLWPFAFKYTNLMLHLLIGWLLLWLGGRIIPLMVDIPPARAWLIASVAGGIWLLHPLQVSTVLYAVQRMAQLSALFTVAAVLSYVIGRQRIQDGRALGLPIILILVPVLTLLAVFSKENGALIPLYILVVELLVFSHRQRPIYARARQIGFFTVSLLPLLIAAVFVVTHLDSLLQGYANRPYTLDERLLTETRVIWFYLGLIFLPKIGQMGLFHDDFIVSTGLDPVTLASMLGILALVAIIFLWRRSRPVFAFAIAWFLAGHALESTFLPLELVFEHRNYLAMYGLLIGLSILLLSRNSLPGIRPGIVIATIILALLATQTTIRLSSWKAITTFTAVAMQDHPNSLRANSEYANMVAAYRLDIDAAKATLHRAVRIAPENPGPYLHLMSAYCIGEPPPVTLWESTLQWLEHGLITPYAISGTETLQLRQGLKNCPNTSADQLLELHLAGLKNPQLPDTYRYLLLILHARTNVTIGRFQVAARLYDEAFELRHTLPRGRYAESLLEKMEMEIRYASPRSAEQTLARLIQLDKQSMVDFSAQIRRVLDETISEVNEQGEFRQ